MTTTKKSQKKSLEQSRRIRFRDQAQLDIIQRAARLHSQSTNAFVILVCETAARHMLQASPGTAFAVSRAVVESLTVKE